jgi:acyl-CoA thioesterase-1
MVVIMTLRKLLWILAGCGLAATSHWWLTRPPEPINLPPQATGPWVAFGDSLTEGYGASEGQSYPAILSRSLEVPIVNLGVSGDTTDGGLKRLDNLVERKPRVVLLCLGGNDGLNQVPRSRTFENLAAIIDRLQAEGSFVVLIGIRSASLRDHNKEHFARLAREKRVLYVPDLLRGIAFKPIYMSDAIHPNPNDEGYGRIAARLEKILRPLLPQLAGTAPAR